MSLLQPQPKIVTIALPVERARSRHLPWGTLAVFLASAAYLMLFYHVSPTSPDEGMIADGAERILRGQVPYRDFFTELGPGSFYLQALIFKVTGISVTAFRLTAWLLGAVLSSQIYFLAKKIIPGLAALIPPLVFITTCYPYVYYVNHHWWGNFFFLLMLMVLVVSASGWGENRWGRRGLDFAAGVFAALTLVCMQPKGAWAMAIGTGYLLLAEKLAEEKSWTAALRAGWGRAFWFLLGIGSSMALAAGYFGYHGALGDWVYDNFTFLFTNYLPYETWPGIYSPARLMHVARWVMNDCTFQSLSYFLGFYFYSVVAPAVGFLGAIWQIKRYKGRETLRARLLLLFLLAALGSLISEVHEPNILHLIWASPVILILAIDAWQEAIQISARWRNALIVAAGVCLVVMVMVADRRMMQLLARKAAVATRRGTIYTTAASAPREQKWIDAIERLAPPGSEAFFFPYDAQFYFFTATTNPTRYDVIVSEFHSKKQFQECVSSIRAHQPPFVFSFDMLQSLSPRAQYPDDLPDFLGPDFTELSLMAPDSPYQKTADVEGMEVWSLKIQSGR